METLIFGIGPAQSNGVGKSANPANPVPTNPNTSVFGNDYRLRVVNPLLPLDDSTNQVDEVSEDLVPGYSFGIPFAAKLHSLYQAAGETVQIILVPGAKGGSCWDGWRRTEDMCAETSLYWSLFRCMRAAWRPGYRYAGLLMALGETDAQIQTTASSWGENIAQFVADFRQDIGNLVVPILYAQLHTMNIDGEPPFASTVRAEQASMNGAIAKVKMVPNYFETNYLHWSTYNTTLMGNSFANIWFNNYRQG